ncbi:hypothetical protein ADP71_31390 [Vitreoscilla sp. C1]|uniref:hypothetical protein n=1 Tax=Vitreoscilla sp. (strain C1) TaxID=96942 RepID=UPI000CDC2793|nr:hypothetical protein [Vitreoscilla sp. C1]AUZ06317.1 hypothetical protein ADP71_31390 [Vitreoscilla sp. C1]
MAFFTIGKASSGAVFFKRDVVGADLWALVTAALGIVHKRIEHADEQILLALDVAEHFIQQRADCRLSTTNPARFITVFEDGKSISANWHCDNQELLHIITALFYQLIQDRAIKEQLDDESWREKIIKSVHIEIQAAIIAAKVIHKLVTSKT